MSLDVKFQHLDLVKMAVKYLKDNREAVRDSALSDTAELFVKKLEDQIKSITRSGKMLDSISVKRTAPDTVEISIEAFYGPIVEAGAPPHIIRPKVKKALAFQKLSGEWVIRKLVHHPGFPARRFFSQAYFEMLDEVDFILGEVADKLVAGEVIMHKEVITRYGKPVEIYRGARGRFVRAPYGAGSVLSRRVVRRFSKEERQASEEFAPKGAATHLWEEQRSCSQCHRPFWVQYEGNRKGQWADEYAQDSLDYWTCPRCQEE